MAPHHSDDHPHRWFCRPDGRRRFEPIAFGARCAPANAARPNVRLAMGDFPCLETWLGCTGFKPTRVDFCPTPVDCICRRSGGLVHQQQPRCIRRVLKLVCRDNVGCKDAGKSRCTDWQRHCWAHASDCYPDVSGSHWRLGSAPENPPGGRALSRKLSVARLTSAFHPWPKPAASVFWSAPQCPLPVLKPRTVFDPLRMYSATGRLSSWQYERLAVALSCFSWQSVALLYRQQSRAASTFACQEDTSSRTSKIAKESSSTWLFRATAPGSSYLKPVKKTGLSSETPSLMR